MSRVSLVILVIGAVLLPSGPARAQEPPYVGWTELLPGLTAQYEPSSENDCAAGRTRCIDALIREMTRRFDRLADSCDHDAIFSLAYLRTTEEYRRTVENPAFFEDTPFVNHEAAVFGEYYFRAYDAWHAGRSAPPAWAIAFDAAADRSVSALGNAFLGMNAHIQRDLPFVFERIGMTKPDGSSRKPDHDRVNEFLNRVSDDLYPEVARRFDPTFDDLSVPGTTVDDLLSFQAIPAWRETAWRNAERLVAARTPAERALVAQSIEEFAASQAHTIRLVTAYGPLQSSAARDAYCAVHHDD
jgi:Family of unknown function (DUF5995)